MRKYEEIMSFIKSNISTGQYSYQQRLPSLRSLAAQFQCNIGTVLKAYSELEKAHLIYASPQSGYYLLEQNSKKLQPISSRIDFASITPAAELFPYTSFQHCLQKATEVFKDDLFNYSYARGLPSLLSFLAKQLQQYQIFTAPEQIVITASSQQALNLLSIMPFPNNKSTVLIEQPTYQGMIKLLEFNKSPVLGITRNLQGLNLDELEYIFKNNDIKFFYTIPRFHNPTCHSYTRQEKERIALLAQKYNVYIVEDDILADWDTDKKTDPLFSYDLNSKVIYLKSYSKILMPGLRVAALILPPTLTETFLNYKQWTDMNSPVISQGALELYLKSGMFDLHKKELSRLYGERMNCLRQLLVSICPHNIHWSVPQAGYCACLSANLKLSNSDFVSSLLHYNIQIMESSSCFLKEFEQHNYLRLSVSKVTENDIRTTLPIILGVIEKYL